MKHEANSAKYLPRPGLRSRVSNLSTFSSLRIRDFRLLWMGQVGTSMGQWMDQVTQGWLIYQITGSALQLGLATAARGLPILLFGIIAGVVADRSGRKKQLIIAQTINAIDNIILATLVLTHQVQPWHIYLAGFLNGTVQAFQQPARQTLISDIVGTKHLLNAMALNSAALNGARAVGPAVAGLLIAFIGAQGSYYVQASLFAFASIWTMQMTIPDRDAETTRAASQPFFDSMKEGLAYVWSNHNIRALMLLALAPMALGFPYSSFMPIFAQDVLHGGAKLQGFLLTCVGIGAFIGAITVATMRRRYIYGWSVVAGATAFGLAIMVFSASRWILLSATSAAAIGAFMVTYSTQNQTLAQTLAPRRLRGRVMSVYLLTRGCVPIGTLLAGVLAGYFGGPRAILIMSSASVVVVWLVVVLHPHYRRLRVELGDRDAEGAMIGLNEGKAAGSGIARPAG